MTRTNALIFLVVLLCGAAGFADYESLRLANHLTTDERTTCKVQAIGLPASHELAQVIGDFHQLLILPPMHKEKLPPREAALIKDLNTNAADYAAAEARQPRTRICP